MPDDLNSTRAQCAAYRDLFYSRGGAREHKVRHVRARYGQNEPDGDEKNNQRQPRVFDDPFFERAYAYAHLRVGVGVLRFQLRRDRRHLCPRLLDCHVRLEPRDRAQKMRAADH